MSLNSMLEVWGHVDLINITPVPPIPSHPHSTR